MDSITEARKVIDRGTFVAYVRQLSTALQTDPGQFENLSVHDFLEGLASWVEDSDGYYANMGEPVPEIGSWKGIADMVGAALIYE